MSKFNKHELIFVVAIILLNLSCQTQSKCQNDYCTLALASYYVLPNSTLTQISNYFNGDNTTLIDDIINYNPHIIHHKHDVPLPPNTRINVPFSRGCVNNSFLGHVFTYQFLKQDTYQKVATNKYTNLTTFGFIERFNSYSRFNVPDGAIVNVPVKCSCGDGRVSKDHGLFVTYPLRHGESLRSISREFNLSEGLLQGYNPGVDFSGGVGLVFIPGKDKNGTYPPFISGSSSSGLSGGAIAGVCIAAVAVIVVLAWLYLRCTSKEMKESSLLYSKKPAFQVTHSTNSINLSGNTPGRGSSDIVGQGTSGRYVGNSKEFSYEELAKATNDFNSINKIGSGGFGDVYLGYLQGKKAAIKRMSMQASREFLAELNVLTRVHHLNLVRLLGYCVKDYLFVVYEYIENGNLSQHLSNSEKDPLPWSMRMQIALDSAKGLEYIHEHTNPVYIHHDIKPENILITNNFRAKVADFGLAKLAEVGNATMPSRVIGTFGYMPPEYSLFGEVTPKVDVYAFGVVLYELISAKGATVRDRELVAQPKNVVVLFEEVLNHPDPNEICKLIDPRLGDDYPLDSIREVAELARACTRYDPLLRPSMRSVVVTLMTLSSKSESWDISTSYSYNDELVLINQVSGR